ncbi:MAG: 6,7-dimethyl-8-ribityllumazine synthase [Bacteroidales bacterium]|nr:6,7-dimethyl-8-ribityllumazine synthase [Bacteroidales bacterium]
MSSNLKNLSEFDKSQVPDATDMEFGIVVSEWHNDITEALYEGAYNTLVENGATDENIKKIYVPGSFELPMGAQLLIQKTDVDAVIILGCVIKGETPHFDYVCQGVTKGIVDLNLKFNLPVIFGLLTTETLEQAQDRAGGKHGNKGVEAAITAIKMCDLEDQIYDFDEDFFDDDELFEE